jgi:hypothetical protein
VFDEVVVRRDVHEPPQTLTEQTTWRVAGTALRRRKLAGKIF